MEIEIESETIDPGDDLNSEKSEGRTARAGN
jgi:hypothetical protein